MTAHEWSHRHRIEAVLGCLRGDWVVAVLVALASGPLHFMQLQAAVNAIDDEFGRHIHDRPLSRRILSVTLKRLLADGLVVRCKDHTTVFPNSSVRYCLTRTGRQVLAALRPLAEVELNVGSESAAPVLSA